MMIRSRITDPSLAEKASNAAKAKAKELASNQSTKTARPIPIISWNDIESVEELLGKGGFNNVSQVSLVNHKDQKFAMKYLRNCTMVDEESFLAGAKDLVVETYMLSQLQHENIVKLHAVNDLSSTAYINNSPYFLILDRLYGTVQEQIRKWKWQQEHGVNKKGVLERKKRLYERLQQVVIPIARAMEYLHSQKVIFRDLKTANVGFTDRGGGGVKLFDFGLARFVGENNDRALTIMSGSPLYMAPEVILSDGNYNLSADVYSFGMFLFEVASLETPFEGLTVEQHYEQVVVGNLRPNINSRLISTKIQKMIQQCWDPQPSARPSFDEIPTRLEEEVRRKQGKKRRCFLNRQVVVVKATAA